MTPQDFCYWLRGFIDGHREPRDMDISWIEEQLAKVLNKQYYTVSPPSILSNVLNSAK